MLLFELIIHANKSFFQPHLMELSVSTTELHCSSVVSAESELITCVITYISLGLGLGCYI